MQIDDRHPPDDAPARVTRNTGTTLGKTSSRQPKSSLSRADRVHLSARAREYQKARQALAALPDIEADKLREIKDRIQSGRYRLDADRIADQMIREALTNDE
ncbi:MAG: flagellar biosynthesis anti-sigma factor FlgM [Desulfobacterales bacterium]|nr:flagellar biosynthesis anti-sigma factor FlgM [Desulfobacterales bacterium]